MSNRRTQARTPLLRISYFGWALVPAALFGAYLLFGLPHVIWRYQFTGSYSDLSARTYHQCTWWGPYGRITQPAHNGTCTFIRFFHKDDVRSGEATP